MNLRGHFLQGLALNLDSFRGNQWRPDRRDKIGEKVKVLARVSGFQWFKPDRRAKSSQDVRFLSRLSGLSQLGAPNLPN